MKIMRIVSACLSVALIYGAITLIIAGGFALTMGFARAATLIAPNPAQAWKDNPEGISPEHAAVTAVAESETSTFGK